MELNGSEGSVQSDNREEEKKPSQETQKTESSVENQSPSENEESKTSDNSETSSSKEENSTKDASKEETSSSEEENSGEISKDKSSTDKEATSEASSTTTADKETAAKEEVEEISPLVGTIVSVSIKTVEEDKVIVEFEGHQVPIPIDEFEEPPKAETTVEVFVSTFKPAKEEIKLSPSLAREEHKWKEFFNNSKIHQKVNATFIRSIKGGFLVDVGVPAFLPTSLATLTRRDPDFSELEKNEFQVEILEMTPEKKNVVVSRKSVLTQERKKVVEDFLKSLEVGQVCEGVVQDITDFGAFIRLGVIDGLLHIKDMSWDHINHPKDLLELNQTVRVKILKVDLKNEKVSLGLKQMTDSLWETAEEDFPPNHNVSGKVVSIKPFGAFVRLKEGIEGLLHISQISRKKLDHPSELLTIGQEIQAIIISVDKQKKRIALGMKQLEPDPWQNVSNRYFIGTSYKGTITGVVPFGAFVQLEEGIEGLIHISKLSENRIDSPSDVVRLGEEVTVSILEIKPEEKRIRLSLVE